MIASRGKENKKIIGSARDALKEELDQFRSQRNQEREDDLRERYNVTELNQGTEKEILRFRAERERRHLIIELPNLSKILLLDNFS